MSRPRLSPVQAIGPDAQSPPKAHAAGLSILSNGVLIVLKIVAGIATGSIAILTEAVHSGIDMVASVVAYVSVRVADEPADDDSGRTMAELSPEEKDAISHRGRAARALRGKLPA